MKKLAKKITSLFLAFFLLTTALPQFIPAQKFTVEASTLRSTIVSYMRSMATIKWTPKTTMNYWTQDGRQWYAGTTYTGIPYTQYGRYTNLETFKSYLNSSNVYTGPSSYSDYRGNDCSSAVAYAWRSVDSSYPVQSTYYMMPSTNDANKVVKVGSWTDTGNSDSSCTSTGRTKMYAAYDQLQPGDAVNDSTSHIRLVVSVNKAEQTVKCIEQSSYKSGSTTSWKVDVNYTYANLFDNGYVPIRLKMLQDDVVSYTFPAQFQVTASSLNIRSGPGTSYGILGTFSNGEIVTVSAISNDWATISYNGTTAYISASYLSYYGPVSGDSSGGSSSGGTSSVTVKTGDMVTLSDDAVWTSGSAVASWCLNGFQFKVGTVSGDTCVLLNPEADYGATGEIETKYLTVVGSSSGDSSGGDTGGSSGGTTTGGLNGYSPSGPGNGLSVYGIDVSYYQGNINWSSVAASGKKFAIIRIGYTYSVDKSLVQDPKFVEYYSGATAAGLDVGIYYYSRATTNAKALEEAKQVMTWLDGRVLDYPIYIDMEADEQASSSLKSSNAEVVKTFCDYVHSQGYLAGMYSGEWFTNPYVDMSVITPNYETWTSNYSGLDHQYFNGSYGMFQYSSSGSVSGISGSVDVNVCYKDYPAIMEKYGLSGHKSTTATYTVNYYVDDTLYKTASYAEGATVTPLAAPTKTGYKFSGWTGEPTTMPAKDVTVKGTFTPNDYNITYVVDNVIYSTVTYPCDAVITALTAPVKSGYKFSGWSNLPETMPAKDIVVTGSFEKLTEYECGDCNMDGVVNVRDATLIQFYLANSTALSDEVEWLCDFNNDGVVNVIDATDLQKSIVGLI